MSKVKTILGKKLTRFGFRKTHKFRVIASNGEPLVSSPSRQAYYNESDMQNAKTIVGKVLVYDRKDEIAKEMDAIFKSYCADNGEGQNTLDTLHLAMDLILKNFGEA